MIALVPRRDQLACDVFNPHHRSEKTEAQEVIRLSKVANSCEMAELEVEKKSGVHPHLWAADQELRTPYKWWLLCPGPFTTSSHLPLTTA